MTHIWLFHHFSLYTLLNFSSVSFFRQKSNVLLLHSAFIFTPSDQFFSLLTLLQPPSSRLLQSLDSLFAILSCNHPNLHLPYPSRHMLSNLTEQYHREHRGNPTPPQTWWTVRLLTSLFSIILRLVHAFLPNINYFLPFLFNPSPSPPLQPPPFSLQMNSWHILNTEKGGKCVKVHTLLYWTYAFGDPEPKMYLLAKNK